MSALYFSEDHEWLLVEGDIGTCGITEFAQEQLGDIVYVELPEVGRNVAQSDEIAVVESVKAASEIYAPVSGDVTESNEDVADDPAKVNADAMGDGSCSFPGAAGDGTTASASTPQEKAPAPSPAPICADATGNRSRGRYSDGRPVGPHGPPCVRHGDSSKTSCAGNGICSKAAGDGSSSVPTRCRQRHLLGRHDQRLLLRPRRRGQGRLLQRHMRRILFGLWGSGRRQDDICSDAPGDGSSSVLSAVGNSICADATGNGLRGRSSAGRPVPPHGLPCVRNGDRRRLLFRPWRRQQHH